MFVRILKALHSDEQGQDLAEYCLLTALVALVALGIFVHVSGGMQALWGGAQTQLTRGNTAATTSSGGADVPTSAPAKAPAN